MASGGQPAEDAPPTREALLAAVYEELQELPPRDRRWTAPIYERLPRVARLRLVAWERRRQRRELEARRDFSRRVRQIHGNEVRAWRRAIAPDGAFEVPVASVRRFCRKIRFAGSDDDLISSFTPAGGSTTVRLDQVCPWGMLLLAELRTWLRGRFGCCEGLWECPQAMAARREVRQGGDAGYLRKWLTWSAFADTLAALGCPLAGAEGEDRLRFVMQCLDFYGGGLIYVEDLRWLEDWRPEPWLSAAPNEEAVAEIKALLEEKYGALLIAWRSALDTDSSNRLSWDEFRDAVAALKYVGDVGGAWRALDTDLSGWIGLEQLDAASSQIIDSFKAWAESKYGSVGRAFVAMDTDGGGSLTSDELRRACRRLKWEGNSSLLFEALAIDRHAITYHNIAWMETWATSDAAAKREVAEALGALWADLFRGDGGTGAEPRPRSAGCCAPPRAIADAGGCAVSGARGGFRSAGGSASQLCVAVAADCCVSQPCAAIDAGGGVAVATDADLVGASSDMEPRRPASSPIRGSSTAARLRSAGAAAPRADAAAAADAQAACAPQPALQHSASSPALHSSPPLASTVLRTWRGGCWAPFKRRQVPVRWADGAGAAAPPAARARRPAPSPYQLPLGPRAALQARRRGRRGEAVGARGRGTELCVSAEFRRPRADLEGMWSMGDTFGPRPS